MKWTHFSTIASPSLIMRTPRRAALSVVLHDSDRCLFNTYRRPRWPRSSPCRLSICRLVVQLLSLSAGKCSFSPHSPQHRPVVGSWSSPFGLRSRPEFRSDRRRWHTLRCSSLGGGPGSAPPVVCSTVPPSGVSQPARARAPPIVG